MYRLQFKYVKTRNCRISQVVYNHKGRPYYAVIELDTNEWYIVDKRKRVKKFSGKSTNKIVRLRSIRRNLIKLGVKLLYRGRTKASEGCGIKIAAFMKAKKQQRLKEQENESQKTSESLQDNPSESI